MKSDEKDKTINDLTKKISLLEVDNMKFAKNLIKSETTNLERDKITTELLLRISSLEKILLEKKVFKAKEFADIFEASVKKLTDIINNEESKIDQGLPIFVPGTLKN